MMPEQTVLFACKHESVVEHEDVRSDGRGDMPPDSITSTCNDVPVPIEQVDVDNIHDRQR
eukprot:6116337-Lingulodinium_polyedra.AAC.1